MKGKADGFAKQGYVALAPDLYRGKVAEDGDTAHQLMRGLPNDRAMRDMKAAVAYLRSRPDVDGAQDRRRRLVHGRRAARSISPSPSPRSPAPSCTTAIS